MTLDPGPPAGPRQQWRTAAWILIGAAAGFGASYLCYTWLNPILEARTDWLRELQGFLFTSILVATAFGAAVGWWISDRIARP
jgi:hypothetical protein